LFISYVVNWPARVCLTDGISIGSAVFAQLNIVTDTQTHRPRYVTTCVEQQPTSYTNAGDAG